MTTCRLCGEHYHENDIDAVQHICTQDLVMTTNETPYRPQVGDMVRINRLVEIYHIDRREIACIWEWDEKIFIPISELTVISRADGVPVESAEVDAENKAIDAYNNMANLYEAKNAALKQKNSYLRKRLADKAADCNRWERAGASLERYGIKVMHDRNQPDGPGDVVISGLKFDQIDELRKELAGAVQLLTECGARGITNVYEPKSLFRRVYAFLARHQPPSAVDTQEVKS